MYLPIEDGCDSHAKSAHRILERRVVVVVNDWKVAIPETGPFSRLTIGSIYGLAVSSSGVSIFAEMGVRNQAPVYFPHISAYMVSDTCHVIIQEVTGFKHMVT